MPTRDTAPVDLSKVTRIEVIDQNGRQYVNAAVSDLELSYQDDGRTLKIFVRDHRDRGTPDVRAGSSQSSSKQAHS